MPVSYTHLKLFFADTNSCSNINIAETDCGILNSNIEQFKQINEPLYKAMIDLKNEIVNHPKASRGNALRQKEMAINSYNAFVNNVLTIMDENKDTNSEEKLNSLDNINENTKNKLNEELQTFSKKMKPFFFNSGIKTKR